MSEETTWLTDEQTDAWRPLMASIMLLPGVLDAQLQRDAGLTHAGYSVLAALSEAPDRAIRLSTLAHAASLSMSRLSHLVDRLVGAGWVERRPVPGDGRSTMAVLTDAGWDKVVATAPGHVDTVRSLVFSDLSAAQTRQLQAIFEKIAPRIDPENRLAGWCTASGTPER